MFYSRKKRKERKKEISYNERPLKRIGSSMGINAILGRWTSMGRGILQGKSHQQRWVRYHIANEFGQNISEDTLGGQVTRHPIS